MRYNRKENQLNLRMLLEEEEEEDTTLELGTDDTEAGDDGDVPEDGDDEAADDEGDTATEEEMEINPEEEAVLKNPLEAQVDAVLLDFETDALKSAKVNENSIMFLVEEAAVIDVNNFAENTARLISNYETLLDIESAIYYRAVAILEKNYGTEVADTFKEIMHTRHGFDFGDVRLDPVKGQAPLALGAAGESGGA